MNYWLEDKIINPRFAIELTILKFNPDISDKDLLDKREEIFFEAYRLTTSNCTKMYVYDYYLYSRSRYV